MKIAQLIKTLSKLNPNTTIIGFDSYNGCLTEVINTKILKHNGMEKDSWHPEHEFKSDIPAGEYLYITFGDI
jgi:hypothetical protein